MDELLTQLRPFLWPIGVVAIVAGLLLIVLRRIQERRQQERSRRRRRELAQQAAERAANASGEGSADDDVIALADEDDGPPVPGPRGAMRTWMVSGVEKSSGEDATWLIDAESRANAKVKAELKGMIVTAVMRALEER